MRVLAGVNRSSVGVHLRNQPQLHALRHPRVPQRRRDRQPGALIAVDATDYQDLAPRAIGAEGPSDDRPALDRGADHDPRGHRGGDRAQAQEHDRERRDHERLPRHRNHLVDGTSVLPAEPVTRNQSDRSTRRTASRTTAPHGRSARCCGRLPARVPQSARGRRCGPRLEVSASRRGRRPRCTSRGQRHRAHGCRWERKSGAQAKGEVRSAEQEDLKL